MTDLPRSSSQIHIYAIPRETAEALLSLLYKPMKGHISHKMHLYHATRVILPNITQSLHIQYSTDMQYQNIKRNQQNKTIEQLAGQNAHKQSCPGWQANTDHPQKGSRHAGSCSAAREACWARYQSPIMLGKAIVIGPG